MKKITQNILCLAMTAALAVSLLPSSFAEDGDTSAGNPATQETVSAESSDTPSSVDTETAPAAEAEQSGTEENEDGSEGNEDGSSSGSENDTSSDEGNTDTDAESESEDADAESDGEDTDAESEGEDADSESKGEDTDSESEGEDAESEDEDTDSESEDASEETDVAVCLYVIDESALPEGSSAASERQADGLYLSLADALSFAKDGDTIKICQNTPVVYSEPITASITLDMNGNSFTGPLICAAENLVVKEGVISAAENSGSDSENKDAESEESDADNESDSAAEESQDENEESGETEEPSDETVSYAAINQEGCKLTLENCVVLGPLSGSFALTNGTFSVKPDADQLASGYYIQENNDLYTVVHGIACTDMDGNQSYSTPVVEAGTLTIDYDGTLNLEDLESYAIYNGASSILLHSKMAVEALPTEELLTEEEKAENAGASEDVTEDDPAEETPAEETVDPADDDSSGDVPAEAETSDDTSAESDSSDEPSAGEESAETPVDTPVATSAPNTIITDSEGSVFFSATAEGGSLKLNDTSTTEKATLRFQYSFTIPVQPENLTWSWKVYYYNETKGKNYSLTIRGVKYSRNDDGSFTSNAIITNIPASVYNTDLNAILTLSFEHNGLTYTVTQSLPGASSVTQSTPEARSVCAVASHLYNNTENDYTDYYYSIATQN